jgi:hypothetical protein
MHSFGVSDMHSKKRTAMKMEKAEVMLNVKMVETYKRAERRASAREQRAGARSVAEDLRMIYMHARARAVEKRELQHRLSVMHAEEREQASAARI